MTVYDLIPFVAPQFSTQDLTRYFTALLRVSDTVLVISGDALCDIDLGLLVAFHREREAAVTIGLKSLAAVLTGSVGFLSDALESVVNLVAALVALSEGYGLGALEAVACGVPLVVSTTAPVAQPT